MTRRHETQSVPIKAAVFQIGYFRSIRTDGDLLEPVLRLRQFLRKTHQESVVTIARRLSSLTAIPLAPETRRFPGLATWAKRLSKEKTSLRQRLRAIIEASITKRADWEPYFKLGRVFDTYRPRMYSLQRIDPTEGLAVDHVKVAPRRWLILNPVIQPHLAYDTLEVFQWLSERLPYPYGGMRRTIEHVAANCPDDAETLRRLISNLDIRQQNILRAVADRPISGVKELDPQRFGFDELQTLRNNFGQLRRSRLCRKIDGMWVVLPDVLQLLASS